MARARPAELGLRTAWVAGGAVIGGLVALVSGTAATVAVLVIAAVLSLLAVVVTQRGLAALATLVILAAAATVPMTGGLRVTGVVSVSDVFTAAGFGLVVATRLMSRRGARLDEYRSLLWGAGLILLGGMIGSFFSFRLGVSLGQLFRFGISTLGILLLVALWAPDRPRVRMALWAFVVGTSASAALGIFVLRDAGGRAIGLASQPNHLGISCLLALGAAIGLALSSISLARVLALVLSAVLVLGIVFSGSRAAFGGALVALFALLALTRSWRLLKATMAVGALGLSLVLLGVVELPEQNALNRVAGDASAQRADAERARYLANTLDQIEDHPLTGVGFEIALAAHNMYLQVWAAAGVVGLCGLGAILTRLARMGLHGRSARDPCLAGVLAGCTGFLASAAASNQFYERWIWFFLATTIALYSAAPSSPSDADNREAPARAGSAPPVRKPAESAPAATSA